MGRSYSGAVRGYSIPAEGTAGKTVVFSRNKDRASMVRKESKSKRGQWCGLRLGTAAGARECKSF